MIGQSSVCKALQYAELCLLRNSGSVELKLLCKSSKAKKDSLNSNKSNITQSPCIRKKCYYKIAMTHKYKDSNIWV